MVNNNLDQQRPEYLHVAFFSEVLPDGFDQRQSPSSASITLACEKFGFTPQDFNPAHGGRFWGASKYGFTFEVEVKWALAEALAGKNLPYVLNIFS